MTEIGQLAKALAAAQVEMKPAVKDSTNPHFKSSYADLEAVNEAARVLAKHGIAVTCLPDGWNEGRVVLRAMLIHSSGELLEGRMEVPVAKQNDAQSLGSALTYGRRYAIAALANIATSDDDGNAAADGAQSQPKKAEPRKQEAPQDDVATRAKAAADDLVKAIGAAGSLADASRVLIEKGLDLIEDDGTWTLKDKTALAGLKAMAPDQYARIRAAYSQKQETI